jgi:hypothetical protein
LKEIDGVLTTRNARKRSSVEIPKTYTVFERNFCNPFVTSTQKSMLKLQKLQLSY